MLQFDKRAKGCPLKGLDTFAAAGRSIRGKQQLTSTGTSLPKKMWRTWDSGATLIEYTRQVRALERGNKGPYPAS